jgi:hypothetical protein
MKKSLMKKLLLCLTVVGLTSIGHCQIAYNTVGGTISLNFNNLNTDFGGAYNASGGSSTFPTTATASTTIYSGTTNPALVTNFNDYSPGGVYSNTGTYNNGNSMRAFRDASTSDLAIGLKNSSDQFITLRMQNTTGLSITSWTVGYNVEQYSKGASATEILFSYSLNGTSFITTNLSGGALVTANNTAPVDQNLASVLSTSRNATITETIANNSEIWFRWTYNHTSGTSVHMGIDDIAVSAVPEPSTYALLGIGMLGLMILRRKQAARA